MCSVSIEIHSVSLLHTHKYRVCLWGCVLYVVWALKQYRFTYIHSVSICVYTLSTHSCVCIYVVSTVYTHLFTIYF